MVFTYEEKATAALEEELSCSMLLKLQLVNIISDLRTQDSRGKI